MKEVKRSMRIFILIVLVGLMDVQLVAAQEVRHSQYYTIMPSINPGATGAFGGDYRFLANYRSSKYSASTDAFTTIYASYDQGIAKYKSDGSQRASYLGAGLSFLKDQAGVGNLSVQEISALIAYNLKIGSSNYLTLGTRIGYATRGVDYSQFTWGTQYDDESGSLDPNAYSDPLADKTKATYLPISAGLMWNYSLPDKLKLNFGLAANRLNKPSAAFDSNVKEELPMQLVVNAGAEWTVPNTFLSLMPLLLYQQQEYYSELGFGIMTKTWLSFDSKMTHIKKSSALYLGAFYRTSGDMVFAGKFDLRQNMAVGLSYDVALNGISNAKSVQKRGAFELTLIYYSFFKERSLLPKKGSVEFF